MLNALQKVLSFPAMYQCFKSCAGGIERYVNEYVRPKPGERVLDIGCGTGDIIEWLGDVEYVGFDLSERYIQSARRKYGHRGKFFCDTVRENLLVETGAFDLVMANGVLHHLADDEAEALIRLAARALVADGRLVTLDGCFVPEQSYLARWVVACDRGRFVRRLPEYLHLVEKVFPHIHTTVLHDLLRIPYTHIILNCSLTPIDVLAPVARAVSR